jgi:putative transcriptional regulator
MAKAEIKNHIRRLRFENREMTQQELADRSKCTRQTIVALEQGKYVPSLALAFRIAYLSTRAKDEFPRFMMICAATIFVFFRCILMILFEFCSLTRRILI